MTATASKKALERVQVLVLVCRIIRCSGIEYVSKITSGWEYDVVTSVREGTGGFEIGAEHSSSEGGDTDFDHMRDRRTKVRLG